MELLKYTQPDALIGFPRVGPFLLEKNVLGDDLHAVIVILFAGAQILCKGSTHAVKWWPSGAQ